jgi:G3E family GTPase
MLHFPSPDIGMFGRRQRHARGHRIPVTIETGSGGTPREPDTVVVIDTFGADEVPLDGGCKCCTVRAELQGALRRLLAERQQGRHLSRVVIQTSSDLGAIRRTFATGRALGSDFYLQDELDADRHGFALTHDAPLVWDTFSRFMATLMDLRGADVLHVKGLLNIEGCRGPVVVQFVQHLAHAPVELQAWPDDDRASRVEFITRKIEEKMVRNLFGSICALARQQQTQTSS